MKMALTHERSFIARRALAALTALSVLLLAACQPIVDPNTVGGQVAPDPTETAAEAAAPAEEASEEGTEESAATAEPSEPVVGEAMATIATRSLRVRATPTDDGDILGGVRQGETYRVIGISSDGAWVQLEIGDIPGGAGWVSASLVTLAGDITNITITDVSEFAEAEETPVSEEEASEEVAEEATEEATEETAGEVAEEATEEATEEASEEVAEEVTEEATEEVAEEATEEPAEEAAPVAETAEITTTAEITEVTEAAPEETPITESDSITETETTTETAPIAEESEGEAPVATPSLGTVTINTDLPLRVRSAPTTEEDNKVGNVFNGETYTVLEVSPDGLWVRIDVPQLGLENGGWVSAEYVVYNNDAE